MNKYIQVYTNEVYINMITNLCGKQRRGSNAVHLWFKVNPRGKAWTEPEELVATRISGSCMDGPNDNENIVDGYVPLRKLYDC